MKSQFHNLKGNEHTRTEVCFIHHRQTGFRLYFGHMDQKAYR